MRRAAILAVVTRQRCSGVLPLTGRFEEMKIPKVALITGVTGQMVLLGRICWKKGYEVHGIAARRLPSAWNYIYQTPHS